MTNSIMIVGAGPGIGEAVARRFGREGWQVVLTARDSQRLAAMVAGLDADGISALAVAADATDPVALREAVARADAITGGLTVVHFNAGVVRNQDLFSMTDGEIMSDVAIDLTAGMHTIRAATDLFVARDGGTILVTGGGLALHPSADWAVLGAGKAALRNLVLGLAPALKERGIAIHLATVAALIEPASTEALEVAELFWRQATHDDGATEEIYAKG